MRCISARVSRNGSGDLVVDEASVQQGADPHIQEGSGSQPGDMTGVWEYSERLSTQDARSWVGMTLPDYLYVCTSWGEHVRVADHYRNQIEETD